MYNVFHVGSLPVYVSLKERQLIDKIESKGTISSKDLTENENYFAEELVRKKVLLKDSRKDNKIYYRVNKTILSRFMNSGGRFRND